jgi:hypothetical protein
VLQEKNSKTKQNKKPTNGRERVEEKTKRATNKQ